MMQQQDDAALFPPGCAFVIGGSGGIGSAVCRTLARNGTDVVFSYRRNASGAERIVEELKSCGVDALALPLQLEDPVQVQQAMDRAHEWKGRIHSLVCATGADISMTYVSAADPDEWRRTIDSDLNGFFYLVRALLPHMRRDGGGSIVAMTSAGNLKHAPQDILSTAPKAGIEAIIRGIAREDGRYGIRANSIALGVIDGGLFHRIEKQVTPEFVAAMRQNTALRRFGTPQEAAEAALFLASARSSYVTGACIPLDGGYSV